MQAQAAAVSQVDGADGLETEAYKHFQQTSVPASSLWMFPSLGQISALHPGQFSLTLGKISLE